MVAGLSAHWLAEFSVLNSGPGDDLLQEQLLACDGNISEAARRLGMSRSTLYRYMARLSAAG